MWIDDDILERCDERLALACFLPATPMVVLGASNTAEGEVHEDCCREDDVPVLKRYGGGGTVLLYPGSIVVSLGTWVRQHYQNKLYFRALNQAVIDALAERWPAFSALGQNGLSDITFGDRKVAGTSLFRSRNYLLYQASILAHLDLDAIQRYLKHPSKEPDYRGRRSHRDFLTSLAEIVPDFSVAAALTTLQTALPRTLAKTLGDEWAEPSPDQFENLRARARGRV
jgi:lipoate-protein ligase A